MYKPIQVDRVNLTIMGVPFPDLATLDRTASAIGSNMFEGFEPTESDIILIREYVMNKITFLQFVEAAKNVSHV
ncbi:MAG: antitoxin VbhA family protein [Spirochaetes bacterium]|nr:antitoxin VbhA family protein [Spirochaetota bacterium]